jgi:hypothetical protein
MYNKTERAHAGKTTVRLKLLPERAFKAEAKIHDKVPQLRLESEISRIQRLHSCGMRPRLVDMYQRFGGNCCLYFQSIGFCILKMEAGGSSQMMVPIYHTTVSRIPENGNFHVHRHANQVS